MIETIPSDLHYFVKDDQIRPFMKVERHDVTDPDAPARSSDEFEVFSVTPPKNQVIVIKAIAPFVCRRTSIGDPVLESFQYIPAIEANGFFGWQPFVQNQSPFIIESDINAPRTSAAAPADKTDRIRFPGFTHISDNPLQDIFVRKDFSFSILVEGDKRFTVVMRVLRVGTVGGIPNPFRIGNDALGTQKRVDFSGAAVYGVTMPAQLYNDIQSKWSMLGSSSGAQ
jgi:hypothetical protein